MVVDNSCKDGGGFIISLCLCGVMRLIFYCINMQKYYAILSFYFCLIRKHLNLYSGGV